MEKLKELLESYVEAQKPYKDGNEMMYGEFQTKIDTIKECIWYLENN